jgi:hypothetical protein
MQMLMNGFIDIVMDMDIEIQMEIKLPTMLVQLMEIVIQMEIL